MSGILFSPPLPCQSLSPHVSQVFSFISLRRLYYIIVPGFSLKASLLHSWQCPAIVQLHTPRNVQRAEVLKEKVPEVILIIIGAKT